MVESRSLVETLAADPDRWKVWCTDKVFPLLDGTNLKKLVIYFELMKSITGDEEFGLQKDAVEFLLDGSMAVDYVAVINDDSSALENIPLDKADLLAKAVAKIEHLGSVKISSSMIYLKIAERKFFSSGLETENWVETFSRCQDVVEKLDDIRLKILLGKNHQSRLYIVKRLTQM